MALAAVPVLLWLAPFAIGQSAEERGRMIAIEARRHDLGFGDTSAKLRMVLRSRDGNEKQRELRSKTLEVSNDGNKDLVTFDSPPDVAGTAVLTYSHRKGDDDQWLYLPALKRVKRIASSNNSGPFLGSEFAYEDLGSQEVEKFTYRWLRDERCPVEEFAAAGCFVIERFPVEKNSGYSRQVVWMDRNAYRTLKVDYYDRKGALLKTLTASGYKQYLERYWRPAEMLMVNHQTGKSTRLIWSDYRFRGGLSESDFRPEALVRGR
jgi:outer membrane lipoprotein-sorting protein